MKSCWAENYSDCSNKISREHLVSKGIFEQQFIYVSGLKWCEGKERKVSIANLTSKVLCENHNNRLSEVDVAGINAIRVFEGLLPESYRSIKSDPFNNVINGNNFERWLLKVAINLTFQGDKHIGVGMSDSQLGIPSQYLLKVVFRDLLFTHKMGLYTLCYDSLEKFKAGVISMTPIHQDEHIGGFLFHVRGFDFFLSLYPGHAPPNLKSLGLGPTNGLNEHIINATPIYRKDEIISIDENNDKKVIQFEWNA